MHIAIVGNGITGITAALRVREHQPDWRITVISGESQHHYSRPALMYIFMGHLRYEDTKPYPDSLWKERRIDLVRDWVTKVDTAARKLELHRTEPLTYDRVLIATGSRPNRFGWPGQDLRGVQGLWGLFDLKTLQDNVGTTRRAVIVGGGLIGIELAEMLHSHGVHVTFLVREQSYWDNVLPPEESAMVGRHIRRHGFDLRLGAELDSISDDGAGRVAGVITKSGERIDCQLVGLTAGVSPNVQLARDSGLAVGRGILVDWSLRTATDGVMAAGDCAEIVDDSKTRGLVQQVWYTGKAQGEVAGDVLAGIDRTYRPTTWFNSAKFLDLEYQTYGLVTPGPTTQPSLYWEHPSGDRSIRIAFDAQRVVVGFVVMGVRYRHDVCVRWIEERRPLEFVLEHLPEANFDPEFFPRFEANVAQLAKNEAI